MMARPLGRLSFLVALCVLWLASLAHAQEGAPGAPTPKEPPARPPLERVRVERIDISPNRILSPKEINAIVGPFVGKELTVDQLRGLAKALTDRMRTKGYFVADAILPAQKIRDGVVHIEIFEGKVGKLIVEGNRFYSKGFIASRFRAGLDHGTIHQGRFQRALMLLNENSDLSVRAFLRPGIEPGTTDVILKVDDQLPLHYGVGYDNFGSIYTSEHRGTLFVEHGNLSGRGDDLMVQSVLNLGGRASNLIQTAYTTPLNPIGTRLGVAYSNGAYTVGQQAVVLDIRGQANIYGLSLSHPLLRTPVNSQDVSLGVTYKDVGSFFGVVTNSRDRYTAARLAWQGDWRQLNGRTFVNASVTRGLAGFVGGPGDRSVSRVGAAGDFVHWNIEASQVQNLSDSAYVIYRGQTQITGQPMMVPEAFSLGGPDSVRGYYQSQVLGDAGYMVSAELRLSPLKKLRDEFQVAFFFDHGGAHLNNMQVGEKSTQWLTGAGFGFRFAPAKQVRARLDLGFPISPGKNSNGTCPVIYGQLVTRF